MTDMQLLTVANMARREAKTGDILARAFLQLYDERKSSAPTGEATQPGRCPSPPAPAAQCQCLVEMRKTLDMLASCSGGFDANDAGTNIPNDDNSPQGFI